MKGNKVKIKKILATFLVFSMFIQPSTVLAHSGRTDANGGHRDPKNVSGLGSYHYHHGYPAHLHEGGICPYEGGGNSNGGAQSGNTYTKQDNTSVEDENAKKAKAKEEGYNRGLQDAYAGESDKSGEYNSQYTNEYKEGYSEGYKKGSDKRTNDINEAKQSGQVLGEADGYNNIKRSDLDYTGNFKDDFKSAYDLGIENGALKLNNELEVVKKESFMKGFKNEKLDLNLYKNNIVKEEAQKQYDFGKNLKDTYLSSVPIIGDKLDKFTEYAKGKEKIALGLQNKKEDTLITIADNNKKKVTDIYFNMKSIDKNGVNPEEANFIVDEFLSKDIKDSYKTIKEYKKADKDCTYDISILKLTDKKFKYMPKKIFLINKVEKNKITQCEILSKEPREIKKLSKVQ